MLIFILEFSFRIIACFFIFAGPESVSQSFPSAIQKDINLVDIITTHHYQPCLYLENRKQEICKLPGAY